jgi:hypothetical protein
VISAIEEAGLDSSRIVQFLKSAATWSTRLQFEQDNALSSLIDRVDLGQMACGFRSNSRSRIPGHQMVRVIFQSSVTYPCRSGGEGLNFDS